MSRIAREIVEAVLLALVVFLLLQATVRNFKVDGSSMVPTLEEGNYLLVNRLTYFRLDTARLSRVVPFWKVTEPTPRFALHAPRRGEVIVFEFPFDTTKDFVKRVLAVPGDTVEVRDGTVLIDGVPLPEPYLDREDSSNDGPVFLGPGEYYVLGDNRRSSNDSRSWGPVPEGNILGKVWLVYWPFTGIQALNILDGIPGFR